MEKHRGMAFGFQKTVTAVIKPDGWIDGRRGAGRGGRMGGRTRGRTGGQTGGRMGGERGTGVRPDVHAQVIIIVRW